MSVSKINPNDCLKVRETMFEFLKRKKQNQLEKSLKAYEDSSRKPFQYSANKSVHQRDHQSRQKSSRLYEDFIIEKHGSIPLISNKKNKFANTLSITPRKIAFAGDEGDERPRTSRKPLIDMISPIKNINRTNIKNEGSFSKYSRQNDKIQQKQKTNPRKSILKSTSLTKSNSDRFSTRKINVSLDNLRGTFQRIFQAGQMAKEKNNDLSIALVNFVKDLQKSKEKQNFLTQKKLGEIKYILNALDSALQIFSEPKAANQIIEEFQRSFSEHLYEIESDSNHNLIQKYEDEIMRITSQKQSEIDELSVQSHKLERQIQKLNKLIEKSQREYQSQLQQFTERQQNMLDTIENLKKQNQTRVQQAGQIKEQFKQKLEEQKAKSKAFDKELKDIMYRERKSVRDEESKRVEDSTARQSYLLMEMDTLRNTFNHDISELHLLYQTKQVQFQQRIQELSDELQEERHHQKADRQISDRILAEANLSRNENMKLAKKNEQLLQDLYRINQDLFQHWLALKDIRTLSQRLHVFQHFERIYLDLVFNPNLFRV